MGMVSNGHGESEALPFDSLKKLFKRSDLVQDVHDLVAGVGHPQDLLLPEVAVDGEDDDVEHRRHPAEEPVHASRVRRLEHLGEAGEHLAARLGGVAPSFLQPPLLEPVRHLLVRRVRVLLGDEGLGEEQRRLELADGVDDEQLILLVARPESSSGFFIDDIFSVAVPVPGLLPPPSLEDRNLETKCMPLPMEEGSVRRDVERSRAPKFTSSELSSCAQSLQETGSLPTAIFFANCFFSTLGKEVPLPTGIFCSRQSRICRLPGFADC